MFLLQLLLPKDIYMSFLFLKFLFLGLNDALDYISVSVCLVLPVFLGPVLLIFVSPFIQIQVTKILVKFSKWIKVHIWQCIIKKSDNAYLCVDINFEQWSKIRS